VIDALYALADQPNGQSLFWRAATLAILSVAVLVILAWFAELWHLITFTYNDCGLKRWLDARRVRRKQRAIAELDAEMEVERRRLRNVVAITDPSRR